ncbi:MAG: CocE/NonD family hydrolase [Nitrococcus sp.]|nr:CocE/NonD family hydrolase [Nitrococcus sp.]
MRSVSIFPHQVEELQDILIPMADGVRLAARVWLPEGAEQQPVPAILEYIPYRIRDLTRNRDDLNHPYFAGHGYASVRVDIRGSGDSEGVLTDEYTQEELNDGVAIIAWLAEQPWCDGNVGMIGISWGGFNGLQIAALQPPALKAVVTVCSTDDRYADDVHYMGGCMLLDNLSWASVMFAANSCPPDPEVVGEGWRHLWLERLKGSGLWLERWSTHQHRDDYWKHGSICEDYSQVRCPIYAVSGWADGYSNAVFRLLANLSGPRKGLVGPWSHRYPHLGEAGPAIGFLQECLRWWDYWLKGQDTGIMDEPMLRAWMMESMPPARRYETRPGRWVAESLWPPRRDDSLCYGLAEGRLSDVEEPSEGAELTLCSPLRTGLMAGKWCSYADGPDLAGDQRSDDAGSLVFDSEILDEPLEILGAPRLTLELAVDRPTAMLAARLNDVQADGAVTRVTYALLNLNHRDGHEHPRSLEPGKRYSVSFALNEVGQVFSAGNRVRLALSTSYWPLAWPPPEPVTMTVYGAGCRLELPVRRRQAGDEQLPAFAEPIGSVRDDNEVLEPSSYAWHITQDLERHSFTLDVEDADGVYRVAETGTVVEKRGRERYTAVDDDFQSARGETEWVLGFKRGEWQVRTFTHTEMEADAEKFTIRASIEAQEQDRTVFRDSWDITVPREQV